MYRVIKEGKGGIVARVVADSISEAGDRITTFELEYHRFIHAEVMTHRLFSRNAMSSRAVPVKTLIEQVRENPATPIHWGKNQSGMQAKEEFEGFIKIADQVEVDSPCDSFLWEDITVELLPEDAWYTAAFRAAQIAEEFNNAGIHKQVVNRLLEPFQMMKVVLTATEFDNFFWLRLDPDAQPEIQELAKCMYEAMKESTPELLEAGEWHTPYVEHSCDRSGDGILTYSVDGRQVSSEEAKAISASCCAQVSYRRLDNTYDKAMSVYDRLGVGGSKIHASPFEHVATPIGEVEWEFPLDGTEPSNYNMPEGLTHEDRNGNLWSGNLRGWVQLRQLLPNHVCTNYEGIK